MNTIRIGPATLRPLRATRWHAFARRIGDWRRRVRARRELMSLGHADLHDIGVSTCDAASESSKPFWTA